jgi:hypothetical protein
VLKIEDIVWCFNLEDKITMQENCNKEFNRKSLNILKDIKKRFYEKLAIKEQYRLNQSEN